MPVYLLNILRVYVPPAGLHTLGHHSPMCTHIENDPFGWIFNGKCMRTLLARQPKRKPKRDGTKNSMAHTHTHRLNFPSFGVCFPLFAWQKRVCLLSARIYLLWHICFPHIYGIFSNYHRLILLLLLLPLPHLLLFLSSH